LCSSRGMQAGLPEGVVEEAILRAAFRQQDARRSIRVGNRIGNPLSSRATARRQFWLACADDAFVKKSALQLIFFSWLVRTLRYRRLHPIENN
jgi:hypothetical protein